MFGAACWGAFGYIIPHILTLQENAISAGFVFFEVGAFRMVARAMVFFLSNRSSRVLRVSHADTGI
jgi:hypothetical protein